MSTSNDANVEYRRSTGSVHGAQTSRWEEKEATSKDETHTSQPIAEEKYR